MFMLSRIVSYEAATNTYNNDRAKILDEVLVYCRINKRIDNAYLPDSWEHYDGDLVLVGSFRSVAEAERFMKNLRAMRPEFSNEYYTVTF